MRVFLIFLIEIVIIVWYFIFASQLRTSDEVSKSHEIAIALTTGRWLVFFVAIVVSMYVIWSIIVGWMAMLLGYVSLSEVMLLAVLLLLSLTLVCCVIVFMAQYVIDTGYGLDEDEEN